jgi:hypothetical protein
MIRRHLNTDSLSCASRLSLGDSESHACFIARFLSLQRLLRPLSYFRSSLENFVETTMVRHIPDILPSSLGSLLCLTIHHALQTCYNPAASSSTPHTTLTDITVIRQSATTDLNGCPEPNTNRHETWIPYDLIVNYVLTTAVGRPLIHVKRHPVKREDLRWGTDEIDLRGAGVPRCTRILADFPEIDKGPTF